MELRLRPSLSLIVVLGASLGAFAAGCGDDEGGAGGGGGGTPTSSSTGSPEQTGKECTAASECYPDVVDGELSGEAICLDRVRAGYCTHECTADEDCCSAEGECETDLVQVCSPFESTDTKMCFLACESENIGDLDEATFCQREASRDFICRSSGGGSENRKICVPGDCGVGAACSAAADCAADLECLTTWNGGYCSKKDCNLDSDCPADTRCVDQGPGGDKVCLRTCAGDSDCSFCRGDDLAARCDDQVDFLDGTAERVCVPQDF
jgi:hypothetical protein